jgi:hypothetical protein
MNRLFPTLTLLLLSVLMVQAQNTQPGRQSENNNQNSPSIEMQKAAQSTQPGSQNGAAEVPGEKHASPDSERQNQPRTEMFPETAAADPVLDVAPLPDKPMSLIGGKVKKIDAVRNRVLIQPFGGGREVSVLFDERSRIYRNGAAATVLGIHQGDRIYVDTMTLNYRVFARTVRVETATGPMEAHGQVVRFNPENNVVQMRESLTAQLISFSIANRTALHKKNGVASTADLVPGTLIDAVFAPGGKGGIADDLTILAVPGTAYVFVGRITNVDLRRGLLDVENENDQKNYELRYDAARSPDHDRLRVGAKVAAHANFNGTTYSVDSIAVVEPAPEGAQTTR